MLQKALKPIDFTEINTFISLVRSGLIYEYVGEELLNKGSIKSNGKKFKVYLFDKDKKRIKYFEMDTLRKCAKKITINALYASPKKSGIKALNDFRFLFPEVFKILGVMKQNNKNELPILMQRIESKCVLDHCSKKIAQKHPEMLLISRHDSLVTTENHFEVLKREFQQLLDNYYEVQVDLGHELW